MRNNLFLIALLPCFMVCPIAPAQDSEYLAAVRKFADNVLKYGRDAYGPKHTALFVDGLHAESLKPVIWKKNGQSWVLCNFASQQPLMLV
jgi:hypothetical protein